MMMVRTVVLVTIAAALALMSPSPKSQLIAPTTPAITKISPAAGPVVGGGPLTVSGTGLAGATLVSFGKDSKVKPKKTSATSLTIIRPKLAVGSYILTVKTAAGLSIKAATPYVVDPVPTLSSVAPNSGTTGSDTTLTLIGTNFVTGTTVLVGTTAIKPHLDSPTQLTVNVPALVVAGDYAITVRTPGGTAKSTTAYQVTDARISAFLPDSAPVHFIKQHLIGSAVVAALILLMGLALVIGVIQRRRHLRIVRRSWTDEQLDKARTKLLMALYELSTRSAVPVLIQDLRARSGLGGHFDFVFEAALGERYIARKDIRPTAASRAAKGLHDSFVKNPMSLSDQPGVQFTPEGIATTRAVAALISGGQPTALISGTLGEARIVTINGDVQQVMVVETGGHGIQRR